MAVSATPLTGEIQIVEPEPAGEVLLKYTEFYSNYQLPQVESEGGYP